MRWCNGVIGPVLPHECTPSLAFEDMGDCGYCGNAQSSSVHVVFEGERVREFAARWLQLDLDVRKALVVVRECEEQGAYMPTMLADPVRGFMRQQGGAAKIRELLGW